MNQRLKGMTALTLSINDLYDMPFPDIDSKNKKYIGDKLISSQENYNKRVKEIQEQLKKDIFDIYSDLEIEGVLRKK